MTSAPLCMRVAPARDLVPAAPPELEALVVCERPAEGAVKRVCAVGDVGLSGRVTPHLGQDPFREVAPVLRAADLSFANLETPLVDGVANGALFAAPTTAATLLSRAGFDLLNLANNHALDHGTEGLADTRRALEACGIEVLGAAADRAATRRPVVTDLGGLRLGWLGCARTLAAQEPRGEGFWEYDPRELAAVVREARGHLDLLIVSIHMGYMYVDYPHPDQRRQVLALLDAGADLVLMHHAHVLQGIELPAAGGVVCYGLGNFLLDWTEGELEVSRMIEEQRSGGLFVFDLDRRGVCRAGVLPVRVDDRWTLRWATGAGGRAILDRLQRTSRWDEDVAAAFHRQLAERATGHAFRTAIRELRRGRLRALVDILRRLRMHHLRMVSGWLGQRLRRFWRRRQA